MDVYILFVIIFIIILLFIYAFFKYAAKIKNERIETNSPNVIPNVIYQTWHTKHLPPNMQKCVDKLKNYLSQSC